ncbi:MAG: hypothetical protein AUJ20_02045 [Comamonadaceae bacterium CG1_02_60_18]|nr:MAG: hypothetical protein AUJ20_02045 [Comamonadaceae bacterium CG1_02_60_18]PIQ53979.1 MAG: hypothetical protein COW02_05605 [Comamonadaceae bacterium CG12_big_fil_rev_8_21_14_0_65_59_15]
MRTTLDLPDETFRQLKAQAALNGMKLKELVTQLIQRGLAAGVKPAPQAVNHAGQPPDPPPVAIQRMTAEAAATGLAPTYPIPIAREADGTTTPYLSNAQLYAILDEEDLSQYQRVLSAASGQ